MRSALVTILGALAVIGLAGCGGGASPAPGNPRIDDEASSAATGAAPAPSAAASPSATAPSATDVAQCPLEASACAFAESVISAVQLADVAALKQLGEPQPIRCFGSREDLGGKDSLCAGAVAGESRVGYSLRRLNSDGGTAVADFRPDLREAVLNGDGAVGPVGIHCPRTVGPEGCGDGFVLFLAGAPNVVVERLDAGFRITALQFGDFAEDRSVLQTGGVFNIPWRAGYVPGRFFPWRGQRSAQQADATIASWLDAPLDVARLTITPSEGPCPDTLTVSGRGYTETVKDAKDPRLRIELLPGRYGRVTPIIRPRPAFTLSGPVNPDGSWQETITITAADRYVCAAGIITVLVGGGDWAVAYYRVR